MVAINYAGTTTRISFSKKVILQEKINKLLKEFYESFSIEEIKKNYVDGFFYVIDGDSDVLKVQKKPLALFINSDIEKVVIYILETLRFCEVEVFGLAEKLLIYTVHGCIEQTVNSKSLYQTESLYHFACYIYQQWKWHFEMLVRNYNPNGVVNLSLNSAASGQIQVSDLYQFQRKFEDLFLLIDRLFVFEYYDPYLNPVYL